MIVFNDFQIIAAVVLASTIALVILLLVLSHVGDWFIRVIKKIKQKKGDKNG